MQCDTFESGIFQETYTALPGQAAYEQEGVHLWTGLTVFLHSLAHDAMQEFLEKHSVMKRLCILRSMDISQPDVDISRACSALRCLLAMLKVNHFELTF